MEKLDSFVLLEFYVCFVKLRLQKVKILCSKLYKYTTFITFAL